MKVYIASHPEAGIVEGARDIGTLLDKLINTFEYESAVVQDDRIICKQNEVYEQYGATDVEYELTELEV